MVEDRDFCIAGENEVAMHTMDEERGILVRGRWRRNCQLRCCKGLGDDRPAVDSTSPGWVPQRAGISVNVLGEKVSLGACWCCTDKDSLDQYLEGS